MSQSPPFRRHLLLALAGAALLLGATAVTASAEGYGELGRFGRKGTGPGEFRVPEAVHAFGVDIEDEGVAGHTSVFVVDEPKTGEYRIQKLKPKINGKGELEGGEFLASHSISPKKAPRGLEGIAVDPALKRIYMLAVGERSFSNKFDPGTPVAATLYAFSAETLAPAEGTKEENGVAGVLAGPAELHAQSDTSKEARLALLAPRGIAVDPSTHDVVVVGQQDEQEKLEGGEEVEPILRAALQRVKPNGELAGRYVDITDCFGFGEEEPGKPPVCEGLKEGEESPREEPTSPIVSQTGRVYVETEDRIWEIPTTANTKGEREFEAKPPKLFFKVSSLDGVLELTSSRRGGGLSFVHEQGAPEGEATIYAYGHVKAVEGGQSAKGVLEFKYAEHEGMAMLSELGWTGGQTPGSGKGKCTIGILGEPSVAGGLKGDVFVLDPDLPVEELTGEADPHVTGFGPGGSGCPAASASKLSATVEGNKVEGSAPVGKPVTLESEVMQANALSVEWRFENLTTHEAAETIPPGGEEYQTIKVEHTFAHEGKYKITETIHTDDLAEPKLEATEELTVEGLAPKAKFAVPALVQVGETATFDGSRSEANGSPITEYLWSFGDGTTGTGSTTHHAYAAAGRYTVKLEVTNAAGFNEMSAEITVTASESKGEEHKKEEEAAAKKKQEEEVAVAAAAKKHQEEEAAAKAKTEAEAKANAEAEAAAKKKQQEEAAAKKSSEKPPTRAQLLAKALKQCKKQPKNKRAKCVRHARKEFSQSKKKQKKK